MYLGECPKIKDGRHFHGNEAREKNHFFFSIFVILIIINVKWNEWIEKWAKQFFDQHLPLTGPRNGSYTLGQVILARKIQSSCTTWTRTKSALTILRTASTWTGPHVTDATRNFDRFYMKAETIKLYWNRPDFALDDHVWQQHVVVLSPSGGLWMRQHERGGCLWCEPYNCRH